MPGSRAEPRLQLTGELGSIRVFSMAAECFPRTQVPCVGPTSSCHHPFLWLRLLEGTLQGAAIKSGWRQIPACQLLEKGLGWKLLWLFSADSSSFECICRLRHMYLFFLGTAGTSELVMLSLDLVKTRLAVMSMEMRKNFIQTILTSLIEKSPDAKILRAVVKIVEEWVKNNSPMAANQVSWQEACPVWNPGILFLLKHVEQETVVSCPHNFA